MSRLFITDRELKLFSDINKEVIKDIIGQSVIYHAISEEKTFVDELYNEAETKISDNPLEIECLVSWQGSETTTGQFGVDKIFTAEVYFHQDDLDDKNIKIREGDFLEFAGLQFEITSLGQPDLIYGMGENKVMTKAMCKSARKGQFHIEEPELGNRDNSTFSQVADDSRQGDIRKLVKDGKVERVLDDPGVTSPFTEDSDY